MPKTRPNFTELALYMVPEGVVFMLDRVGVGYSANADGYAHFGITIDGQPLGPGFGDFEHEIGALSFADMCIVQQRIKGPAEIRVEGYVEGGAPADTYTLYGRIFGYQGPDR